MKTTVAPWFLMVFLTVWAATMVYVVLFIVTVTRIRRLTGEARGPDDWLDVFWRPQLKYLGWIFSAKHRPLGDLLTSRLVRVVRVLFVVLAPSILIIMFVLAPLGAR